MTEQALLERWSEEFLRSYARPAALLLGDAPTEDLGYRYVREGGNYEAVVIGSLSAAELLHFSSPQVLRALLEGMPVYLVQSGLEHRRYASCANRVLWTRLLAAERELRALGVEFVSGGRRLVTAEDARAMKRRGQTLPQGCRATPLALEILEDKA